MRGTEGLIDFSTTKGYYRINVGVLRPRNQENHGKTHEGAIHLESSCLSKSNEEISKTPTPSGLLVTRISKCCVHLL